MPFTPSLEAYYRHTDRETVSFSNVEELFHVTYTFTSGTESRLSVNVKVSCIHTGTKLITTHLLFSDAGRLHKLLYFSVK